MPIGQRKISTSDITISTAPQTVVESNNAEFNGLSDELTKFMQEGQLSGKGWESAKKLAGVYETITHTFQMVSDQLMQANAKVKNTSGLIGTQIDESAIEAQISSNKAAMTTLSYSNTIWNSTNPGVANQDTSMATANNNYITSLTNQNNELQKVIDGLNDYDSRTKSVYDETLDSLNKLESLMKQVSDSSKSYNAKTGLFTTDGIDMKIVSSLDDTYNNFEGYKTLAKDLGISESEAIALCKKYKVSPNDDVVLTNEDDGTISMANKTTGQDYTGFMNRFLSWLQTTNDAPQENQEPPIAGLPSTQDDLDKYVKKHTAEATKDAAESGKPAEYQVDGEAGAELSGFGALVQWANIRNKHVPQKTIKGTDYVIMEEEMDKEAQKEKAIQDQIDKATNPANNWSQTEGIGYGGNVHR